VRRPLARRLDGFQIQSGRSGEEKNISSQILGPIMEPHGVSNTLRIFTAQRYNHKTRMCCLYSETDFLLQICFIVHIYEGLFIPIQSIDFNKRDVYFSLKSPTLTHSICV
jgi:hypothetical protein